MAPDAGRDVSHARRFVRVLDSLHRSADLAGSAFLDGAFMEGLAAELACGAFAGDLGDGPC